MLKSVLCVFLVVGVHGDAACEGNETCAEELSSMLQTQRSAKETRPPCKGNHLGTPPFEDLPGKTLSKKRFYKKLAKLNIEDLYNSIAAIMKSSNPCWEADGPQDGDEPNYAGLFGRLAWHCAGTFRHARDGKPAVGGCEGGRLRFWPENEWRDNGNLEYARALLAPIKKRFGNRVSWGDLMAFSGAVGIKESGGPIKKFCFGRVDEADGANSIELGRQGVKTCSGEDCVSDFDCETNWQWPQQDPSDHHYCNFTQANGRVQASHSVGLIYVYPEGPKMKNTDPDFDAELTHNRMPSLSALEVRDTFNDRMGWTDEETVALIAGGHTLGRAHGDKSMTMTSGFEGPWTRTPSKWNHDYLDGLFNLEWVPSKSPAGADQWWTKDRESDHKNTMRLTSDMALKVDPIYREIAQKFLNDPAEFESKFADAWFKLVHRSTAHPAKDDLEKDAGICTDFSFVGPKPAHKGPLLVPAHKGPLLVPAHKGPLLVPAHKGPLGKSVLLQAQNNKSNDVSCCEIARNFNLVPWKSWGSTPGDKQRWWDAKDCNTAVGGSETPNCEKDGPCWGKCCDFERTKQDTCDGLDQNECGNSFVSVKHYDYNYYYTCQWFEDDGCSGWKSCANTE